MIVRDESAADCDGITQVTEAAFRDHPFSQQTEHFIVKALRNADALTVSLVAEEDGEVVGHIGFSPVVMSDGTQGWYGLGPVSVSPVLQKQGIGKALINEGLARLRALDAKGCVLVGDPAYYPRFGFRNPEGLTYDGVPPEVVFVLPFVDAVPEGTVTFHDGFSATS